MRKHFAVAALFLLSAVAAHAQASVYVTYSPTHLTNVATGIPSGFATQEQYTSYWASGVGAGVTFDFLPLHVVSLGLDLRGSTRPGTLGFDTAMAGLKLGVHPPAIRIKPYVQASAGYLGTRTFSASVPVGSTDNGTYIAWEVLGGIDCPLMHFVDLRVIELGGGQGISTGPGANASLFTVNTGLVVHF